MKKITVLLFLLSLSLAGRTQKTAGSGILHFYVGTYTEENGSEGIYSFGLDPASGKLHSNGLAVLSENPSFLALTPDGKYLVAVRETLDSNNGNMGYIELFSVGPTGHLSSVNKIPSGGAHPCHVAVNGEGDVLASNYSGGSVALLRIEPSGELSDVLYVAQHSGSGTVRERQEKPHVHSTLIEKGGNRIFVADLGIDQVKVYTIDRKNSTLKPYRFPGIKMIPGSGPRHMAMHPGGKTLFVANELSSSVSVVRLMDNGGFKVSETVSTLPPDYKSSNTCADIHVSQDGNYLYVSNRGMNSITIFGVKDSKLTLLGHEGTRGETPRNFTLSPDNDFLLVANQNSNNIVSFRRNRETGLLTYMDIINAFRPVCLLFN